MQLVVCNRLPVGPKVTMFDGRCYAPKERNMARNTGLNKVPDLFESVNGKGGKIYIKADFRLGTKGRRPGLLVIFNKKEFKI